MNKSQLAIHGGEPIRKKLFKRYNYIGNEEKDAVNSVLNTGILSKYLGKHHENFNGGDQVKNLESEWAHYFNIKHAIVVNSATSGLIAAVGALNIGPGDQVIVSPFSMTISASAPLFYGAIPVFADVEENFFCLDPKSIESKINSKTKAIIVVDIFGQPYNATEINQLAKKHNLKIIEDAAQSPYAKYHEQFAGTLGDVGVYSLNYHKHIHCGEGGVVVTNSDEIAERVRLIRNHAEAVVEQAGITNLTNMIGQNLRMNEIEAAITRCQLRKLQDLVLERYNHAQFLSQELSKFPGITAPLIRENCTHSYYLHGCLFDESIVGVNRNSFINALKHELPLTEDREAEGVTINSGYVKPLYLQPLYQKRIAMGDNGFPFKPFGENISYEQGICPVAEKLYNKTFFCHDFMNPPKSESDLRDIINAFEKVYSLRHLLKNAN